MMNAQTTDPQIIVFGRIWNLLSLKCSKEYPHVRLKMSLVKGIRKKTSSNEASVVRYFVTRCWGPCLAAVCICLSCTASAGRALSLVQRGDQSAAGEPRGKHSRGHVRQNTQESVGLWKWGMLTARRDLFSIRSDNSRRSCLEGGCSGFDVHGAVCFSPVEKLTRARARSHTFLQSPSAHCSGDVSHVAQLASGDCCLMQADAFLFSDNVFQVVTCSALLLNDAYYCSDFGLNILILIMN